MASPLCGWGSGQVWQHNKTVVTCLFFVIVIAVLFFQKRAYKSYAKALPVLKRIGISSVLLRKIIGSLEVGCGMVLTLVPGKPKDVANFLLLIVMLAVLFFHQLVGDPLKRYAHALVFGILLTCRLLIARQSDERPEREESREDPHISEQEKNKVKQS